MSLAMTVPEREAFLAELANRYLGADEYIRRTAENTPHVVAIHMRPERWLTENQGKSPI